MENIKIAWVLDQVLTCGGVKIPFGYCRELQKLGIDSGVYANGHNEDLESYYGVKVKPISDLANFTDNDIIIAVWWKQVLELEKYKGRKIQFVQGRDLYSYIGSDWKEECLKIRQRPTWEIMAVSKYAGEWVERPFTIVPNAIDEQFFYHLGLTRDIDALIEGNNDPNKNIDFAIEQAEKDGHKKIAWMGVSTRCIPGIEMITNPPQKDIPAIYQRSKHFYKYSNSEGFCLPLWEAIASGCEIHTHNMGGNEGLEYTFEQAKKFNWENSVNILLKYLCSNNHK